MLSRPGFFSTLACCALAAALFAAPSVRGDLSDALEKTEASYQAQLRLLETSMQRLYWERLHELERKAAETGAYEAAEAYHQEAQRIRALLGKVANQPLTLPLFATEAQCEPPVTLVGAPPPLLNGWNHPGNATWSLPNIPKGGYEVRVIHRSNRHPVSVKLSGGHYYVTGTLSPVPEDTTKPMTSSLGNLRITEDTPTLTLSLQQGTDNQDLSIESVELISHGPLP